MEKQPKKTGKMFWTFEPDAQRFMVHLARLRLSNKAIMKRTGFSDHQITYSLHKYKLAAGMGVSLRQRWANGTDPLIDDLLQDRAVIEAMDAEIEHKVTPVIMHPTPKTVRIKEKPAKRVQTLVKELTAKKRVVVPVEPKFPKNWGKL